MDVEKNQIIENIRLSHYCRGVASDGKVLIISCGMASTIVNLKDMSHTILYGVQTSRISIFQGHIYGTIWFEGKISCYKSTGELLWTFVSDDIKNPRGLTVDKNGFVYLTCEGNNKIVVVSQDGKTCKTILSEADGIKHPREIDINRETGTMIVSSRIGDNRSCYDSAFVDKISSVSKEITYYEVESDNRLFVIVFVYKIQLYTFFLYFVYKDFQKDSVIWYAGEKSFNTM